MPAGTLLVDRPDPDCLLARARQSFQDVDRPTVVGEVTAVRQRREPEPLRRGRVAQSLHIGAGVDATHEMEHQLPCTCASTFSVTEPSSGAAFGSLTYVASLSGVIGAKGIVSMAAIKEALVALGLSDVRSPCAVRAPSLSAPRVGRSD